MRGRLRTAVGVVLSLLLLIWALRDVSLGEVLQQIRRADPLLFALSILVTLAGFWIRAVRWGILLLPATGPLPLRPRVVATFIGFAANNVLPARVGEFARALSLARLASVPVAAAFATLVVERLLDGLVLIGLLFTAMSIAGFPASAQLGGLDLREGAVALAVAMAAVAVGLYFAASAPRAASRLAHLGVRLLPTRSRTAAVDVLRAFARGLAVLRDPRLFAISALLALGQWVFLAVSFLLAFRAFGIGEVPFAGAVFLQSLISLAVAIPSSPGFFGPFEAAARVGLGLWNVPAEQAISFAIGFHIGGFLPVTIIGVYYVWTLNLRWSEVRHSEEVVEAAIPPESTASAATDGTA